MGLFDRLKNGLAKTRQAVTGQLVELVTRRPHVDASFLEELEEILIEADVGVEMALELVDRVRKKQLSTAADVLPALQQEIAGLLGDGVSELHLGDGHAPGVILMVGVNGSGKTTTAGKLAYRLAQEGRSVVLGAADTFRAAAAEQLGIWAKRTGALLISQQSGSDSAAVAFDAVQAARARDYDVVIIDTAGRLQTKTNLMQELQKICRVIKRELPDAPHEVLLVLDATVGQNGLSQARVFTTTVGVTGIVLTKLDGTAKGGIVVAIKQELGLPVKLVGLGEGMDDLQVFDPAAFAAALTAWE